MSAKNAMHGIPSTRFMKFHNSCTVINKEEEAGSGLVRNGHRVVIEALLVSVHTSMLIEVSTSKSRT